MTRPTFGLDVDRPMDKTESRRDSWRRSSRKYRATQARERAQATLFGETTVTQNLSTLRPRNDRVIVKVEDQSHETASGLTIPDTARPLSLGTAKVVAVGPGRTLDDGSVWPVAVKPGDRVVVAPYAGNEIDDNVRIVRESDLLAVLE
jgi:chaperonin GroES